MQETDDSATNPQPGSEAGELRQPTSHAEGSEEAEALGMEAGCSCFIEEPPTDAWSMRRHGLIATAAMDRLESQNAREQIARILDEGGEPSLGEAAQWADKLRGSNRPNDQATNDFLGDDRNRRYSTWHYVNMPARAVGYDRQRYPQFTRRDDVVQIILLSFDALRNPGPNARFVPITALRWLTHLVGDVHQPIHVGCGYIANAKTQNARLEFDPDAAAQLPHDLGGNKLILPVGANLHSFWDSRLGPNVIPEPLDASTDSELVAALPAPTPTAPVTDNAPQSVELMVNAWATASLVEARKAYDGLRITSYTGGNNGDYRVDWEGEENYRQRCSPIVSERMGAAASNLAHLLDTLWP